MKLCSKCSVETSADDFYGKDSMCKSCRKEYNKAHRQRLEQAAEYLRKHSGGWFKSMPS